MLLGYRHLVPAILAARALCLTVQRNPAPQDADPTITKENLPNDTLSATNLTARSTMDEPLKSETRSRNPLADQTLTKRPRDSTTRDSTPERLTISGINATRNLSGEPHLLQKRAGDTRPSGDPYSFFYRTEASGAFNTCPDAWANNFMERVMTACGDGFANGAVAQDYDHTFTYALYGHSLVRVRFKANTNAWMADIAAIFAWAIQYESQTSTSTARRVIDEPWRRTPYYQLEAWSNNNPAFATVPPDIVLLIQRYDNVKPKGPPRIVTVLRKPAKKLTRWFQCLNFLKHGSFADVAEESKRSMEMVHQMYHPAVSYFMSDVDKLTFQPFSVNVSEETVDDYWH